MISCDCGLPLEYQWFTEKGSIYFLFFPFPSYSILLMKFFAIHGSTQVKYLCAKEPKAFKIFFYLFLVFAVDVEYKKIVASYI